MLYFDSSDGSCIADIDPTVNLDNLCIIDVEYDGYDEPAIVLEGECTSRSVFPGYSWALDLIDGVNDEEYRYFDGEFIGRSVELFIIDTGIRTTHDEFSDIVDRVINHELGGNPAWFDPNMYVALVWYDHGTKVASAAGGFRYGTARGNKIHNFNAGIEWDNGEIHGYYIDNWRTDVALGAIRDYLANTWVRGVINMSFGSRLYSNQYRIARDELHQVT